MSDALGFKLPDLDENDWKWLEGAGTLLGGIGGLANSLNVNKQYEKMNNLYAQNQNRQIAREEQSEDNLVEGINVGFNLKKKKVV